MNDGKKSSRRRRSSSLLYQEPPESMEHMSDQAALPNLNANWVNAKGGQPFSIQRRGRHQRSKPDSVGVAGLPALEQSALSNFSKLAC